MRRFCNVTYAYLAEGADSEGLAKLDATLNAPLGPADRPAARAPSPAPLPPERGGAAALAAAFSKARR